MGLIPICGKEQIRNMKTTEKPNLFRKADIICIAASVLLALLFLLSFRIVFPDSDNARLKVVTEDTTEYYSLNTEKTVELTSNGLKVTVKIENGEAWIESSTCPDGICRTMGKISKNGQISVCAPAKVAISIESESEVETDAVAR